ncbi:MAG: glycosyltransferase [Bacteroidales bacterium]|nr:glycosyltransferase [Bacteroidales bacterium]
MKRVLFDGIACQNENNKKQQRGGSEYGKHILRMALDRGYNFDIVLYNGYTTPDDLSELLLRFPQSQVHYVEDRTELYDLIDKGDYDVFYTTYPYTYTDYSCNTQMICVVQGLRKIECPWDDEAWRSERKLFYRIMGRLCPRMMSRVMKKRNMLELSTLFTLPHVRIIATSEHTKYSLLNFFPSLQPRNIRVYYPYVSTNQLGPDEYIGNYFLLLNANQYEKNIPMAIEVLDRLFTEERLGNKHVMVTGVQPEEKMSKIKNKDRFLFLPYVPTEMVNKLYREAFCLIYPSLNEGFGTAPIKAMACGVPVIASSATSIPEVCGGAAMYFSADNPNDLANRILQVTLNDWQRKRLRDEGLRRVDYLLDKQQREIDQCLQYIFG